MAGVSRVGTDLAGGTITGPGETSVLVNGDAISVLGDAVASHGSAPHNAATMIEGSATVFAGGIAVVRAGDAASCGHTATGSANVNAG
jgi:uncharacterized Zn-binding protein involved in type VI secretion